MTVALYYGGEELENLEHSQGEHTENPHTDRQTDNSITEATLILWIVGLIRPILR